MDLLRSGADDESDRNTRSVGSTVVIVGCSIAGSLSGRSGLIADTTIRSDTCPHDCGRASADRDATLPGVAGGDPEGLRWCERCSGNVASYDAFALKAPTLAFAITIHKSQGSEFSQVVVRVLISHYVRLQRNLFYTAITCALRLAVLVGDPKAVAVRNDEVLRQHTAPAPRLGQVVCNQDATGF